MSSENTIDSQKLNDFINKSGKTISELSSILGHSEEELIRKINGELPFTNTEVSILCLELNIVDKADMVAIFLPEMVSK